MRLVLAFAAAALFSACYVQSPPPQGPVYGQQPPPQGQPPQQGGDGGDQGAPGGSVGPTGNLMQYNGPLRCDGADDFTIDNADIYVQGPGVSVNGSCTISIRNSRIVSTGGPALLVSGAGDILLTNSYVSGQPPMIVSGSGTIRAEYSQIDGNIFVSGSGDIMLRGNVINGRSNVTGTGDIRDDGNQWQQ